MPSRATLGAPEVRRAMSAFHCALVDHQAVINRLNVYPVPDGDTGTNMSLTLDSVVKGLADLAPDATMAEVAGAISYASLMGARGNSGVILSQLLRGMSERLGVTDDIDAVTLSGALAHAAALGRSAVVRPVEGTILSVADALGAAAEAAARGGSALVDTLETTKVAGEEALERTPQQLPVLAQAGVVDAGGRGLMLLIDAFLHVTDERPLPTAPEVPASAPAISSHDQTSSVADLRYEVMYMLEAPDETIAAFKEVWAGIGDSIVVVGGDGLFNCHIHTDDIGAAIEAAIDAGRPRDIRVTDLIEQVEEERWVRDAEMVIEAPKGPPPTTGVVAVVVGEGIGRIFRSLGVHGLVIGGQTMNPSTAEILAAIEEQGTDEVIILPNNKNIIPVAKKIADLTDCQVHVVLTESTVEGFAALLAYDPEAHLDVNAAAMSESAARVISAEVTRAVRDSDTDAGAVKEGDWIGVSRDGIEVVADSVDRAVCDLLHKLLQPDHELVTMIEGDGASTATTRRIVEWVREHHEGVDVEVHHGGQPLYPYLLGIE